MTLIVPALILVVAFSLVPLLVGVGLAFTDARFGLQAPRFTGVENVVLLFTDAQFWASFWIGLVWAFATTAGQYLLGLGLAPLLNQRIRGRWLVRTLTLVPWAMPPVIVAQTWKLVYHPDAGILNYGLKAIGLSTNGVDWLGSFAWALPAVILVGIWAGMPQTTIVLLAGLQNIPAEMHEAAAIDGAGVWRRFRAVTLPLLKPVTVVIVTLNFIWNFNSFGLVYVLTAGGPGTSTRLPLLKPVTVVIVTLNFIWNFNSFGLVYVLTAGGPGTSTRLPLLFAYEEAFAFGHFGYASMLGLAMVAVISVLLFFYLRAQREDTV
ncbi:MAG: ABC transporter permease subunit [Streptosporangiales bacterium]|nr:ABC transporter permease subunit [Streptosporangiales bacterium]